ESYDIINAIRNEASSEFRQYVPLANKDNISQVGAGIMINPTTQNEFLVQLINRIGLTVIKHKALRNPLRKFKKGMLPNGSTIQEIFVDLVQEHLYDPEDAEQTVFRRSLPNIEVVYHEVNRQSRYDQTIQSESLGMAFVSWQTFDSFVTRLITAIYSSAEVDEYRYMKLLIDNYYSKGNFKVEKIVDPTINEHNAKEF